MNNNKKNKVKDFLRKEGFYFILFICLCVVATTAAFTITKNNSQKESVTKENEFSLNVEGKETAEEQTIDKQNAERVEGETENELVDQTQNSENINEVLDDIASNEESSTTEVVEESQNTEVVEETQTTEVVEETENTEVVEESQNTEVVEEVTSNEDVANSEGAEEASNTEETTQVTNNTQVKLVAPIEGVLSRSFGEMIRLQDDEAGTVDKTRRGVDLTASLGDTVKSAAEGQIADVSSNPEDGIFVVVSHANGLKTKYSNLAEEVSVAIGDKVTQGQEIGSVGNTSMIYTESDCGTVLNLQVENANGENIDPAKYFTF